MSSNNIDNNTNTTNTNTTTNIPSIIFPEAFTTIQIIPVYIVARDLLPRIAKLNNDPVLRLCVRKIRKTLKRSKSLWKLKERLKSIIFAFRTQNVDLCDRLCRKTELVLKLFHAAANVGKQRVEREIAYMEPDIFELWIVWLAFCEFENPLVDVPRWIVEMGKKLHSQCVAVEKTNEKSTHFKQLLEFSLKKI